MTMLESTCPRSDDGRHEFRFGYMYAKPKQVGQPDALAVFYCTHCLQEEDREVRGVLIPAVQVQLVQQQPPHVAGRGGLFGLPEGM
jgi:hypothetical protein